MIRPTLLAMLPGGGYEPMTGELALADIIAGCPEIGLVFLNAETARRARRGIGPVSPAVVARFGRRLAQLVGPSRWRFDPKLSAPGALALCKGELARRLGIGEWQ